MKTPYTISTTNIDALIFDLDGVITDTASVHAAAWKKMFDRFLRLYGKRAGVAYRPFEIETDYRRYVDGKPRLDGIRSFLESREIKLPEGKPEDPDDADTIQALGKRKNDNFLQQIEEDGVKVYKTTVDLIDKAKNLGLKTAVISSSKNCTMVLDSVKLLGLFEVKVDGMDSEDRGIVGKPAPDIFLEAARQLGVEPERAVVIEDAVSGVQAGRAGNFAMVIGIARTGGKDELLQNGASVVVADLAKIKVVGGPDQKRSLPSALDDFDEIARRTTGKQIVVFLDYDGTLCPIVETPEEAIMSEAMRHVVALLSRLCPVGIISGRDVADVRDKVRIETVIYAGSHGFDIDGPAGLQVENTIGEEFLPALDKAKKELSRKLDDIDGVLVERKKYAIAVHYRRVASDMIDQVEKAVDEVLAGTSGLRKTHGKKIFELRPETDWHKGKALFFLLDNLELSGKEVLPFYIGDDVTDEDAFAALQQRGIGIVVRDRIYESAAGYSLDSPNEVHEFLLKLTHLFGSVS